MLETMMAAVKGKGKEKRKEKTHRARVVGKMGQEKAKQRKMETGRHGKGGGKAKGGGGGVSHFQGYCDHCATRWTRSMNV